MKRISFSEIDGASGLLADIAAKVGQRKPLHASLGKRAEIELRDHFAARNGEGNKQGWPSQQFWNRIRTATAYASADEAGATVVISDPAINQKIHGGTITPKEGKFLALPAIAEAYGKSPRIFDFLLFRRFKSGSAALVESDHTKLSYGRKRKDGTRKVTATASQRGRVWYWLARSVTQAADPRALPEEKVMADALIEEAKDYMDRLAG